MYNRFDTKNILIIIISIMLLRGILTFDSGELLSTLFILPGLVLGLTFHEFAHAKMSDRLGDPTPERQGRLTLSPMAHMDLMGTICLLFAGFGWGKPVEIDPTYYRNPAKDSMIVALAGPVSNFILAFFLFLLYAIIYVFVPSTKMVEILLAVLVGAAQINLSLRSF